MAVYVFLIGRILLGGFFLFMAVQHFSAVGQLSRYAGSKGVPAPRLAVLGSGALLLIGGLSIVTGIWPGLGVLAIAGFLIPVSLLMHAFWSVDDPQAQQMEFSQFSKNLALLGATLALLAVETPWPLSLLS